MAVEGSVAERQFGVFCKWLAAVALYAPELARTGTIPMVKWRTARPWLAYKGVHSAYLRFLRISVGHMQCGRYRLSNEEVHDLVMFERKTGSTATRPDAPAVRDLIMELYDTQKTRLMPRGVVIKDVNLELKRRCLPTLTDCSLEWLGALRMLGENCSANNYHNLKLCRRFPHQKEVATTMLLYYAVDLDASLTESEVFNTVSDYFRLHGRPFLQTDLSWRATWETYGGRLRRLDTDLEPHVRRLFVLSDTLGVTRKEVVEVVNYSLPYPIPSSSPMWDHAFGSVHGAPDTGERLHLTPKVQFDYIKYLDEHYERALEGQPLYKLLRSCQRRYQNQIAVPFFLRALHCQCGYKLDDDLVFLRRKQTIPWNWLVRTFLKRVSAPAPAPAPDTETINMLNFWLVQNKYAPYPHSHWVWEFTRWFKLRYDISGALAKIREESPAEFESPPRQIPKTKGSRNSTRIFDAFMVEDAASPIHTKRARLEVNRRLGCGLKRSSPEWQYATTKRARSENQRPSNEKKILREPRVYTHDPQKFSLSSVATGT
jgi:hypothetical protein